MAGVLKGSQTQILAASLKSPAEASAAILSGTDHLTLPFDVLNKLTYHENSEEAGGRITDTQGQKYSLMMKNIVASNGKIHKDMIRVLKE
jgi:transaldolase